MFAAMLFTDLHSLRWPSFRACYYWRAVLSGVASSAGFDRFECGSLWKRGA